MLNKLFKSISSIGSITLLGMLLFACNGTGGVNYSATTTSTNTKNTASNTAKSVSTSTSSTGNAFLYVSSPYILGNNDNNLAYLEAIHNFVEVLNE